MAIEVTVRYFAGAQAAAGTAQERLELAAPVSVAELSQFLAQRHGPGLQRVLSVASFLVDEVVSAGDRPVATGSRVDVLPPFAGG
jgi:molybdopterin converting factor small subunit